MNIFTALKSKFIKLPEKYNIPEKIVEMLETNCCKFNQHEANKIINNIRPQLDKLHHNYSPKPNNKKDFIGPPKLWKKEYEDVLKDYLSKFYSTVDKSGYMINQFNNILNSTDYDFKFCQDIKCSTTGFNKDTDKYEILIKIPENSDFEQAFRDCVHELAHAMCQRSTTHAHRRYTLFEEDKSGVCGEIESIFMEKVADKFMLDEGIIDALNPDKHIHNLTNSINEILPTNDILNNISAPITKSKIDTFFKRCLANKDNNIDRFSEEIHRLANDPDNRSLFRLRYVYGEVVSTNLFADYLSDPENTMAKFSDYIQKNDGIEIDKACETLLGKDKTFSDAVDSYNPMKNQRTNIHSNTLATEAQKSSTIEMSETQAITPPTSDAKSM